MQALSTIARRCSLLTRRRFQQLRVMPYLAAELDLELQVTSPAQSCRAAQHSRAIVMTTFSDDKLLVVISCVSKCSDL
jgi:hypothetical protein